MGTFARFSISTIIFIVLSLSGVQADSREISFLRLSDGMVVGYKEMIDGVRGSRLIFVGEYHDSELHHRLQLEILKDLKGAAPSMAVGLEMFTAGSQDQLDRWVRGEIQIDAFIETYYRNWTVPWSIYNNIFTYIRENRIDAIGLNLSKEIFQKTRRTGISSLTRDELKELPSPRSCDVDRGYMDFIKRVYYSHGRNERFISNFCESLLLKDRVMAYHIAGYLDKNPERGMVVFTGVNHAWRKGVPAQTKSISKGLKGTVILLGVSGYTDPKGFTSEDADYILIK